MGLLVAAGCERAKTDGSGDGSGGTSGGASSAAATSAASTGPGASTDGGGETQGAPECDALDYGALLAVCEAAADGASCEASIPDAYPCAWCVWVDFVPTTLDPDGTCHFGPVNGSCRLENLAWGDGCEEGLAECLPGNTDLAVYRRTPEGGIELNLSRACTGYYGSDGGTCGVDAEGNPLGNSPPECACLCDPSFPDEP